MDHPHRDLGLGRREAREVRLGADDREGARVDRVAVADVVLRLHHPAHSATNDRERRRRRQPVLRHRRPAPSDQRHRRPRRLRAALAAAREVQRSAAGEQLRPRRDLRRQRPRREPRRSAGRRAGTGDHRQPRIVRLDHQPQPPAPPPVSAAASSASARARSAPAPAPAELRASGAAAASAASTAHSVCPNGSPKPDRHRARSQREPPDRHRPRLPAPRPPPARSPDPPAQPPSRRRDPPSIDRRPPPPRNPRPPDRSRRYRHIARPPPRPAARRPAPHRDAAPRRHRPLPKPSAPAAGHPPPARRIAAASGRGSAISDGSSPASGPLSTPSPVSTAIPSSATAAASAAADAGVSPRSCRLPRAVTSTSPLPSRAAARASPASCAGVSPPAGVSRTSQPSPVSIGAASVGQAPRRQHDRHRPPPGLGIPREPPIRHHRRLRRRPPPPPPPAASAAPPRGWSRSPIRPPPPPAAPPPPPASADRARSSQTAPRSPPAPRRRSSRGRSPSSSPDRTTAPRTAPPPPPARRRQTARRPWNGPDCVSTLGSSSTCRPAPPRHPPRKSSRHARARITSNSRPPMNRADGTGSPKALTLISVSRAGSSATALAADRHRRPPRSRSRPPRTAPPAAADADRARRWNRGSRNRPASPRLDPGRAPRPPAVTGPSTSAGRRTGAISPRQPMPVDQRREVRRAPAPRGRCGSRARSRRCTNRPVSRDSPVLRIGQDRAPPAPPARESVASCQNSCAPRFSPSGSRGDPVSAKPGRTASYSAASSSGAGMLVVEHRHRQPAGRVEQRRRGPVGGDGDRLDPLRRSARPARPA